MGTGRMSVKYRKWTKDDDELLIRMYRDKKTQREIAAEMGRSVSSINGRVKILRENGIDMREEPVEEAGECYMSRGEIAASYRQAKDKKQQITIIAQLCCLSREAVIRILSGEGAADKSCEEETKKRAGKRYTAAEDAAIIRGYSEGKKAEDIGRELGRGRDCIIARMHKLREEGLAAKK